MVKIQRFIKEYVSYLKKEMNNSSLSEKDKEEIMDKIDKILMLRKKGVTTVTEVMRNLLIINEMIDESSLSI